MKIAICFVGQLRTACFTMLNIKRYIGDLFPVCDFFIHTWDITTPAAGVETETIELDVINRTEAEPISNRTAYIISKFYNPKKFVIDNFYENYTDNPYSLPFYHSVNRVLEIKKSYEEEFDVSYDEVVIMRPDIVLHRDKELRVDLAYLKNYEFCYLDMHNVGSMQIDSSLWVFKDYVSDALSYYNCYRLLNKEDTDDQIHLKNWISQHYHRFKIHYLGDNRSAIYRKFHAEYKINPDDIKN